MKKLSLFDAIKEAKMLDNGLDADEAKLLASKLNLDFNKEKFSFSDWLDGVNHEIEHKETVKESPSTIAKIALDHLKEDPMYYRKLKKIES